MPSDRYRLHSGDLLRILMKRAPGGKSLHVRELAEQAGVSKSKVHSLITGDRPTVGTDIANRIAEAVGVHTRALFDPVPSTPVDEDSKSTLSQEDTTSGSRGAFVPRPTRGAHQLGEDPGPDQPHREGQEGRDGPLRA